MKRVVMALLVSVALAGCAAGGSADCSAMQTQAKAAIDDNKACSQDRDCVVVISACSLPGECGVALNATGAAQLQSISNGCQQDDGSCPHCPSPPGGATCMAGVCKCLGGCVGDSE